MFRNYAVCRYILFQKSEKLRSLKNRDKSTGKKKNSILFVAAAVEPSINNADKYCLLTPSE